MIECVLPLGRTTRGRESFQ